jgi:hypothetical protein
MSKIYTNGVVNTGVTINVVLSDIDEGIYTIYWSASTFGTYQAYIENNANNVVYVSEIYNLKPDNEVDNITNVYVGL